MFGELLKKLSGSEPAPLGHGDARLALTALLVRCARTDHDYTQEEMSLIDKIIAARFDLTPFEAAVLRGEGEMLEAEAPDTVRFTRAIKDAVAHEDRIAVVEALWQVVLADGSRDVHEDALLRMVVRLLGIPDKESALARRRVEESGR